MGIDLAAPAVKNDCFFGLDYSLKESKIVIVSIPWDVTTSYRPGTSRGPQAVLEASYQLDLFHLWGRKSLTTKVHTYPFAIFY